MQYRQLGSSDLKVSEISIGSWLTYGVGVERERAKACVHRALDLGINLIDTANVYGKGAAEEFLGETLAGVPRKNYILATKLFGVMSETDKGLSRAQVFKQLDASLKRLRTDYIDLYQCHRYDKDTPLLETMEALTEVVKQGKARYVGFSEWPPQFIEEAFAIPNVVRFVSSQPEYSMLWRRPQQKVIPICKANGVSQIVWSPLAQGVISGKYLPGAKPSADTRAASDVINPMPIFQLNPSGSTKGSMVRPMVPATLSSIGGALPFCSGTLASSQSTMVVPMITVPARRKKTFERS